MAAGSSTARGKTKGNAENWKGAKNKGERRRERGKGSSLSLAKTWNFDSSTRSAVSSSFPHCLTSCFRRIIFQESLLSCNVSPSSSPLVLRFESRSSRSLFSSFCLSDSPRRPSSSPSPLLLSSTAHAPGSGRRHRETLWCLRSSQRGVRTGFFRTDPGFIDPEDVLFLFRFAGPTRHRGGVALKPVRARVFWVTSASIFLRLHVLDFRSSLRVRNVFSTNSFLSILSSLLRLQFAEDPVRTWSHADGGGDLAEEVLERSNVGMGTCILNKSELSPSKPRVSGTTHAAVALFSSVEPFQLPCLHPRRPALSVSLWLCLPISVVAHTLAS
nr:hypothetical protein TgIa.1310c [Toxoplasma gondii RH]